MRFGTPAITTRGFSGDEVRQVGEWIVDIINRGEEACPEIKEQVIALCEKHPLYSHL